MLLYLGLHSSTQVYQNYTGHGLIVEAVLPIIIITALEKAHTVAVQSLSSYYTNNIFRHLAIIFHLLIYLDSKCPFCIKRLRPTHSALIVTTELIRSASLNNV